MLIVATRVERGSRGEDRLVVERSGDRTFVVVADGAGGTGAGGQAAELLCARVETNRTTSSSAPERWGTCLFNADHALVELGRGGEATAVVVEISESDASVRGASVGDSGAWLVTSSGVVDLTERQHRKPLLGSGKATPVDFGPVPFVGRVLVATDGLFKYASIRDIAARALHGSLEDAASALVAGVRLRSGALQDDVALVLCERTG